MFATCDPRHGETTSGLLGEEEPAGRPNQEVLMLNKRSLALAAALAALSESGELKAKVVSDAIRKYGLDPEKPNPVTV